MKTSIASVVRAALLLIAALALSSGITVAQPPPPEKAIWNDPVIWRRGEKRFFGWNDFQNLHFLSEKGDAYARAVQEARRQVAEGNYPEAFAAFAEAARLQPSRVPFDEWGDARAAQGDLAGAIAAYRQMVYRAGTRDWKDSQGRSIRALVTAGDRGAWSHDRGGEPVVLMRYALLLAKAGEEAEAVQVFRWGFDGAARYDRFRLGESLAGLDLGLTPENFAEKRATFEAVAHTIIALTEDVCRTNDWPGLADIAQCKQALAARPDFAPAWLHLGKRYGEIAMYWDDRYYPLAEEAYNRAMQSGDATIQGEAREALQRLLNRKAER